MKVKSVCRLVSAVLAVLALGACSTALAAGDNPRLELKVASHKEVVQLKDGKEAVELVPASEARPGDVLVYTITYRNTGKGTAKDASVVDPIPEGTDYVPGSATGAGADITCSIDGGKTYHREPVMQSIARPDGTTGQEEAAPEMYTHVKWMLTSVPAGGTGELSFKVKLE